ncbi:MAG: hypothetical protein NT067_01570 [Candidatus Diapherotrites archaeon]|nr:hypothetical protein [Candidatus Diapherotrites archaeon]
MARLFFCILAISAVLLFPALAAGSINASLTASAPETREAQAVDFNLKLAGFPESLCEFEWDFGDGSTIVTQQPFASHAYYLEYPLVKFEEENKNFQAKVKIIRKAGNEALGEKAIGIVVHRSEFKPRLTGGSAVQQGQMLQRGIEAQIALGFFEADGQRNTPRFDWAGGSENILPFTASINGGNIAFEWDDLNVNLEGTFVSGNSFGSIEKLEVKAGLRGAKEKTFSIPLFFEQPEISVSSPFGEGSSYEVDSRIGMLAFDLKLPGGKTAQGEGDFTAWLLSDGLVVESQKLSFKNGKWSAEFSHVISGSDYGALEVTVSGQDESGIAVEKNSFIVQIAKPDQGGQAAASGIWFVFPKEGKTENSGGVGDLNLVIFDPAAFGKTVSAWLYIDGKQHQISLACNESGQCYARLPLEKPLAGKHDLNVVLRPPFSGRAGISTDIVEPTDWFTVWVLTVLVFAAGLAGFTLMWRKRCRKLESLSIKGRLEEIAELEKKAKIEFFKRQISESAYREKLLKLEQEKEQILKKSGRQKKEKK